MASLSGHVYVPLEPPEIPPPPDFNLCHPFYGLELSDDDCMQAAGQLPVGNRPLSVDSQSEPFHFPIASSHGNCVVTVQWAYPHSTYPTGSTFISPNAFRSMASWLLFSCVEPSGLGGFGTIGIKNMMDWTANEATTDSAITTGLWPADATFFTVSITGANIPSKDFEPGFNDPEIAAALSDGALKQGNKNRAGIFALTGRLMQRIANNGPSARPWWSLLGSWNRGGGGGLPASQMVYTCDAKLGAPSSTDCAQLAYSGLGPPSDSITVGPGPSATRILSFKSCRAAISALATITLTWAQIGAGLNTLIDTCVEHPLRGSQGGRAFHGVSPSPLLRTRGGRERERATTDDVVTGLDALPPSVNIMLSAAGTDHN